MVEMTYTGVKFCGRKIFIESSGDPRVDKAFVSTFCDDYRRTAPLEMSREDVKLVLGWMRGEVKVEQPGLFDEIR